VERPRKSVLSAYLWLIALGVLGAHRFYLRRPGTGLAIALLFLAGPVLYLTGTDLDDKRLIFAALGAWALVISAVLADLAMIPGMVEAENGEAEDRRAAVISGDLDPSFQATLRRAGRTDEADAADAPRKSALPDDYERPWRRAEPAPKKYRPGDE